MRVADVILDIQSNDFNNSYKYVISDESNDILNIKNQESQYGNFVSNLKENYIADIGSIVIVPFGKQLKLGFVVDINHYDADYANNKNLKKIFYVVSKSLFNKNNVEFAKFLSKQYICSLATCIRLFIPVGLKPSLKHTDNTWTLKVHTFRNIKQDFEKNFYSDSLKEPKNWKNFVLTEGQEKALNLIDDSISNNVCNAFLLNGVTGSGKTEVYLRAIDKALDLQKNAVVLVPEISLTPQIIARFKDRFGNKIAIIHSKMTPSQRNNQYNMIKAGEAKIAIGARSAMFSPMENIGVIVVDEEHENSYKQDKNPRYITRDCAWFLAKQNNAVLILGSATPSLESLYNCSNNKDWYLITLYQRTNLAKLPKIEVINMADEFKSGNRNLFSDKLKNAILSELKRGNKVLLFHNRRGFSNYMFCRNCGYVPICDDCSTSLTYHQKTLENGHKINFLSCHHCEKKYDVPVACPKCNSHYIAKYGAGTQNVEENLVSILNENNLSSVDIIRIDADTSKKAIDNVKFFERFSKPGPAVLLGTQMIAKGLDFNDVTLVGIVLIDTNLALPDFRNSEKTFNLIQQVAGRAGRSDLEGKVIIQTYDSKNECIELASNYDTDSFHNIELTKRNLLHYPPYYKLVNIVLSSLDLNKLEEQASCLFDDLIKFKGDYQLSSIEIMPACSCVIEKIRKRNRMHILIKYKDEEYINNLFDFLSTYKTRSSVKMIIDVDPISLL